MKLSLRINYKPLGMIKTVSKVDFANQTVTCQDGDVHRFDKCDIISIQGENESSVGDMPVRFGYQGAYFKDDDIGDIGEIK